MGTIAQVSGTMASFPKGFSGGVNLQGMPVMASYATSAGPENVVNSGVYWVDSVNGNDSIGGGGLGGTQMNPFKTLSRAIAVAKLKDVINVKQFHTETISTATYLNLSVKGITINGFGTGTTRPKFTLDTANTSTITVSADGITINNCQFVANFLNIAVLFTLTTAKSFALQGCSIYDTSSVLNFLIVVKSSATSNANDGLTLSGNNINLLATSGVVNLVAPIGTHDSWVIAQNSYTTATTGAGAVIPLTAGKILTNFLLLNNLFNLQNAAGTATGILITTNGTTNTGFIHGNYEHSLPTTPLFVTGSSGFVYGANYHADVADLSGYLLPAADV